MEIKEIELTKIKPNPYQTRLKIEKQPMKLLVKSIRERGLIAPITLLKEGEEYIIVSGHRRFEAHKRLQRKTIPAIIKERDTNNELKIDLVHENLIREDLTPIEKSLCIKLLLSEVESTRNDISRMQSLIGMLKNYKRRGPRQFIRDDSYKDEDIFHVERILKTIGVSENNANLHLALLDLPQFIADKVEFSKGGSRRLRNYDKITITMAYHLTRCRDKEFQKYLFERCLAGINCRCLQSLVDEHISKVHNGEWDMSKIRNHPEHYIPKFKSSIEKLYQLSDESYKLAGRLNSFRFDTLLKLEGTLPEMEFVMHGKVLKKELEILLNRVTEMLQERGFTDVKEKSLPFVIDIHPNISKRTTRMTFPAKVTKSLGIPFEQRARLQLKVTGVKLL